MSEQHTCQAYALFCIDFRLHLTKLARLLEGIGYAEGSYDHGAWAGAGKGLLSDQPEKVKILLEEIATSLRLHHIKEVVILYHDNCGAYNIKDPGAEDATQSVDLHRLTTLIEDRFPELKVKTHIIQGTPTGDLTLKVIA